MLFTKANYIITDKAWWGLVFSGELPANIKKSEVFYMFQDRTIVCLDCGQEFIFTAGEQEFYNEKGFENEPKRCRECRTNRRNNRGGSRAPREMFTTVCAECGAETEVPFQPVEGRPVYCTECFRKQKESAY